LNTVSTAIRFLRPCAKAAACTRYFSSPVCFEASQCMPAQKPPVQSPSEVVVHPPVSGSAQCGYALPTRRRVSSMRFCILPIASVHIGMIALPSIQSRITDTVGESHARRFAAPRPPPLAGSMNFESARR
jgi:hypothetical protein